MQKYWDKETVWGIVIGTLLSAFIAGTLVIAAAKAGITPGVSPLVILFGWVVFGKVFKTRTKKFLAVLQVTGSAGAAVTAGVVFTAPAIQLLTEGSQFYEPVSVGMLILASLAGTFLGFGFVGLATKKFLKDPKLPAPEAVACDRMIKTAVDENPTETEENSANTADKSENAQDVKEIQDKPAIFKPRLFTSLILGLILGAFIHILEKVTLIKEDLGVHFKFLGMQNGLAIPASGLFIGIGALLTLPTAILIFLGSTINFGFGELLAPLAFKGIIGAGEVGTFTKWLGAGAMTVTVLYSLIAYFILDRKSHSKSAGTSKVNEKLLEIDKKNLIFLIASIIIGVGLLIVLILTTLSSLGGLTISFFTVFVLLLVSLIAIFLLTNLGGLLSLQVGSSASPVSGTVFIALMIMSVTGLMLGLDAFGFLGALFLMPIIIATCVSICAANDSSQDYKTLQLNGYPAKMGFLPQLIGLLAGAIVVPIVFYVAWQAYGFGQEATQLACPQASFYSSILDALFIDADIPWVPVFIGIGFGVLAVAMERIGKIKGLILSSLAFAVGIYLPSFLGIGILIGGLARFAATRKIKATSNEGILAAAGLITGDAFLKLIIGILILGGVAPSVFELGLGESTEFIQILVGSAAIIGLVTFVYLNNKRP